MEDPNEPPTWNSGAQVQNENGDWVEAVPLPFYLGNNRCRCKCGRRFPDEETYRGHYALAHILHTPYVDPASPPGGRNRAERRANMKGKRRG